MRSDASSSARAPRSAVDKLSALPSITDLLAALTEVVTPSTLIQVDSIPTQIRAGFDFGLRHLPREPFTPINHISNDDDASREAAAKKLLRLLRDGRIAGPFDYDWLRPQVGSFRFNPLSVTGKRRESGQPPKHRVIENMSYPRAYDAHRDLFWFRLCGCFRPSFSSAVATAAHDDLLGGSNLHSSSPLFWRSNHSGGLRFPSITIFKQVDDVVVFCPDAALAPDKGFDWTHRFTCFPNTCTKVRALHNVRQELSEWKEFLGDANNLVYCFALKPPSTHVDASSDASEIALGIVIDSRTSVFPLPSNWEELRDAHITVAETWAVESAHRTQFLS
ncbi:BQ5605_C009g05661 [Microbotryum silenes-dioicae]|uniref:BQ5605_C009g05661 protein n=1 Tax=Microbotryum silenes-dioicae TaxID=796604 RepID=A0A2X0MHY1_9BASI|nr:BQ5605_C009g05661 [Microbotryum silenes-dioicae]